MSEAKPSVARPSVLSLKSTRNPRSMPPICRFLRMAAFSCRRPRPHQLGDEWFMLLQLMDDPTKHPVAATVAWITPHGAQGGKTQGIGVHFSADESGKALRGRIEQILAGHLARTAQPTRSDFRPPFCSRLPSSSIPTVISIFPNWRSARTRCSRRWPQTASAMRCASQ